MSKGYKDRVNNKRRFDINFDKINFSLSSNDAEILKDIESTTQCNPKFLKVLEFTLKLENLVCNSKIYKFIKNYLDSK